LRRGGAVATGVVLNRKTKVVLSRESVAEQAPTKAGGAGEIEDVVVAPGV